MCSPGLSDGTSALSWSFLTAVQIVAALAAAYSLATRRTESAFGSEGMTPLEKLNALVALRGQHDQTVRAAIVAILYGREKIDGRTPTERFLEDAIARVTESLSVG